MTHRRNRPGRPAAHAIALLGELARYWLRIYPTARRELELWRQRAATIPDPALRRIATGTLASEGLNAEGAALFAIVAPTSRRSSVIRLLVCFQVMYDYLDALTEQPADDPLTTSRLLHQSLAVALGAPVPSRGYYAHHPHKDDGGYLDTLVASFQQGFARLPAASIAAPLALRAVRRSAEGQSHSHAAVYAGHDNLIPWARAATPTGLDLYWWETAAAAESSLIVHALLAAAADPGLTRETAEQITAAYWPWITGLNALLDDLVDATEDAAEGTHSYAAAYPSPTVAAHRLALFAQRATTAIRILPRARQHAIILAAMTSFYLAAPGADSPDARPAALRVQEQLDIDTKILLATLAARRRLGGR